MANFGAAFGGALKEALPSAISLGEMIQQDKHRAVLEQQNQERLAFEGRRVGMQERESAMQVGISELQRNRMQMEAETAKRKEAFNQRRIPMSSLLGTSPIMPYLHKIVKPLGFVSTDPKSGEEYITGENLQLARDHLDKNKTAYIDAFDLRIGDMGAEEEKTRKEIEDLKETYKDKLDKDGKLMSVKTDKKYLAATQRLEKLQAERQEVIQTRDELDRGIRLEAAKAAAKESVAQANIAGRERVAEINAGRGRQRSEAEIAAGGTPEERKNLANYYATKEGSKAKARASVGGGGKIGAAKETLYNAILLNGIDGLTKQQKDLLETLEKNDKALLTTMGGMLRSDPNYQDLQTFEDRQIYAQGVMGVLQRTTGIKTPARNKPKDLGPLPDAKFDEYYRAASGKGDERIKNALRAAQTDGYQVGKGK